MIFSSGSFIAFFAFVFAAQWHLIPAFAPARLRLRITHIFLLIASYFFYMFSVWEYGVLIAISTLIDFYAGRIIGGAYERHGDTQRAKRIAGWCLFISLSMNLGILAYFKYTNFLMESVFAFLESVAPGTITETDRYSLLLNLILPVGISFFTFQSMSYTIDVYRRVIPMEKDLVRFALFISFFPQLVAGPIVTAKEFLPQLEREPEFDLNRLRAAMRWFALGYFKKVVLADNMSPVVDGIYAAPENYGAAGHWLGAVGFWVQVYCDFSGYSDMAWGAALALGYQLPENFRMPYLSRSVTEHWQRWHISLIRWNRDYLYFPLGGNRSGFWRHKFNVFFTMFVAGVWHGANWTYVIWGAIHGAILAAESAVRETLKKRAAQNELARSAQSAARMPDASAAHAGDAPRPYFSKNIPADLLKLTLTSFVTIFFGTMFRAADIGEAWLIMQRMLGLDAPASAAPLTGAEYWPIAWGAGAVIAGHVIGWRIFEGGGIKKEIPVWLELAALPLFILLCIQLGASDAAAFIYFVF